MNGLCYATGVLLRASGPGGTTLDSFDAGIVRLEPERVILRHDDTHLVSYPKDQLALLCGPILSVN